MMDDRPSLSLSCREAEPQYGPPPIEHFRGDSRGQHPESELLALALLWPEASIGGGPQRMIARHAHAPLPMPLLANGPADLGQWSITHFWRNVLKDSGGVAALAGIAIAAPLVLTPASAFAADPAPASGGEEAAATATEAQTDASAANDLAYTGTQLWEAVRGARVLLTLSDGTTVLGRLITQTIDELAVVRHQDGLVLRIPKSYVLGFKVQALPDELALEQREHRALQEVHTKEKRPASGKPMLAVGTGLSIAGGSILTSLLVAATISSSAIYYGFPAFLIGTNMLGVGIPLVGAGAAMTGKYNKWKSNQLERQLSFGFGPTKNGWAGGLSIKF